MKIVEFKNKNKKYLASFIPKNSKINWIYTRKTHFSKFVPILFSKKIKQQNLFWKNHSNNLMRTKVPWVCNVIEGVIFLRMLDLFKQILPLWKSGMYVRWQAIHCLTPKNPSLYASKICYVYNIHILRFSNVKWILNFNGFIFYWCISSKENIVKWHW
jgi:hypothetical protein